MKNVICKLGDGLIIRPLDNDFFVIVNPLVKNSLRVINHNQKKIIDLFDGKKNIDEIGTLTGYSNENILQFVSDIAPDYLTSFTSIKKEDFIKDVDSLNLWVHITDKCNLACPYCHVPTVHTKSNMQDKIRLQFGEKLIQSAKEDNIKSIHLRFSGGEPLLLFKDWTSTLVEWKKRLSEVDCSLSFGFLTNLTLLTDEIIEFAKEHNIGFGVSLDGVNEYHDLTRKTIKGRGTFSTVKKNIEKLVNNGIKISTTSVITQENMNGLPDLTDFLIKNKVQFIHTIVHGEDIDRKSLLNIFFDCFDLMEKAIEKQDFNIVSSYRLLGINFAEPTLNVCNSGVSSGAIYSDGNIYFCHSQFGVKKPLGSLSEKETLKSILTKGYSYHNNLSKECDDCNLRYICSGGCPLYRVNGKSPNCDIFKEIVPRLFELVGKVRLKKIKKHINKKS